MMARPPLLARGAVLLAAMAVAGCSGTSRSAAPSATSGSPKSTSGVATGAAYLQALQDAYTGLVRSTLPSVVEIRTSSGLAPLLQ